MLLTQLSAEAMDSLFMGQFNIPLCILNTMDKLKNGRLCHEFVIFIFFCFNVMGYI